MCCLLLQSQDVTVYKLKDDIEDAKDRLMFLLDYAIYPSKYLSVILKENFELPD